MKKVLSLFISLLLLVNPFLVGIAESVPEPTTQAAPESTIHIDDAINLTVEGNVEINPDAGPAQGLDINLNNNPNPAVDVDVTINGNVEVTSEDGKAQAVNILANEPQEATNDIDVTINGDVSATADTQDKIAQAINVNTTEHGTVDVHVTGDVSADAGQGNAFTISAGTNYGGWESKDHGDAVVNIIADGNVSAQGDGSQTTAIEGYDVNVQVGGSVTSSEDAVKAYSGSDVTVGGNVQADGNAVIAVKSTAEIAGNVSAGKTAVHAENNSVVEVGGTVTAGDNGVESRFGSTVAVGTSADADLSTVEQVKALETGTTAVTAGGDTGVFVSHESKAVIAGNVVVTNGSGIDMYNDDNAPGENTLAIAGNVSASGDNVTGIHSTAINNTNNAIISGDLTVTADGEAKGIHTEPGNGLANIAIGGDVNVTGSDAVAVDAGSANVQIDGTVTSSGEGVSSRFGSNTAVGAALSEIATVHSVDDLAALGSGKPAVSAGEKGIEVTHGSAALIAGDLVVSQTTPEGAPDGSAEGISIYNDDNAGGAASSALIAGDVKVTGEAVSGDVVAKGVASNAVNAENRIMISGDLLAKAVNNGTDGSAYAVGIEVNQEPGSENGSTDIQIGGKLEVTTSGSTSTDNDVTGKGVQILSDGSEDTIAIEGPVSVSVTNSGSGWAVGDGIEAEVVGGGKLSITVDDVNVQAAAPEEHTMAEGLRLTVIDGELNATVNGDVVVTGNDELYTTGLSIASWNETDKGAVNAQVAGNIESTGVGVYVAQESDDVVSNIIVDGEIKADTVSVLVDETINTENVNLTVYKMELNTINGEEHAVAALTENDGLTVNEASKAIEQQINYIIKVEANPNGTVSADKETAKESETVTMRISANAGYHVVAAYNGEGQQVPLLIDANGNYYVTVPRGGGVYLSARIDPDAVEPSGDSYEDDSDNRRTVTRVTPAAETTEAPEVLRSSMVIETPIVVAAPLPQLSAEQQSGEDPVALIMPSSVKLQEDEVKAVSALKAEDQLAVVLKQAGLDEVIPLLGLSVSNEVQNVLDVLTTDLSSAIVTAQITVNGEQAEWKIVSAVKDGVVVRYAFRQKADGTWEYIVMTDDMLSAENV